MSFVETVQRYFTMGERLKVYTSMTLDLDFLLKILMQMQKLEKTNHTIIINSINNMSVEFAISPRIVTQ